MAQATNQSLTGRLAHESTWPIGAEGLMALGLAGVLILAAAVDTGSLAWYVARASGMTAHFLLSLSVIAGLVISTKAGKGWLPGAEGFDIHKYGSYLLLGAVAIHGLALLGDSWIQFSLLDVLIPGVSPYRPLAVAGGIVAVYLTALLVVSFEFRTRLGPRTWRTLHHLSFPAYALALWHGLAAGTDANESWAQAFYLTTAAPVLFLVYVRLLTPGRNRSA